MAELVESPVPTPYITYRSREQYVREANAYVKSIVDAAKRANKGNLVGETVRFSVADGYAVYVVWNTAPLQLVHVEEGDAYSVHPALIRGLNLDEVEVMVEWDRKWARMTKPA